MALDFFEPPEHRLIVYGSLAPGEVNNFLLAGLEGDWEKCIIRGHMDLYRGFKVFKYDPQGEAHLVWLFSSSLLPGKFTDLDDFEGEEYQRVIIPALVGDRVILAYVYQGKSLD
jgi:gamma-glutamylcyclotransferase (GGCT)/AIG2-like uncharacterized protein YtfP